MSATCLMTRTLIYKSVGGMKACFASNYQDVDMCLRIRQLGLSIVYVANVEIVHHEGATRGLELDYLDREILADRWQEAIAEDPYYNVNFARNMRDYAPKEAD